MLIIASSFDVLLFISVYDLNPVFSGGWPCFSCHDFKIFHVRKPPCTLRVGVTQKIAFVVMLNSDVDGWRMQMTAALRGN